jgi:TetR/AcrR family transcriptional regulator
MPEPKKKRGRERVYDAERTRQTILDAAEAVFAEHGFDGATMDTIAARAGYNKSLLFQYFGDKLGLYSEVLKRADRDMSALLARAFAPGLSDETITSDAQRWQNFLRTTFGALFDYMVEHPHLMRMFNWEQAEGWQTFAKIASQFEPADLELLEGLFSRACQAGLLRPDLDVVLMLALVEQICWSVPASLPLYQLLFAGRPLSSADILTHVRTSSWAG